MRNTRAQATNHVFVGLSTAVCLATLAGLVNAALGVDVWITTGDRTSLLSQKVDATFDPGAGQGGVRIDVRPDRTFQTIEGFGAAMTDSSAWVFDNLLDTRQRRSLMRTLFSPDQGIGISYLRVPMGASDFTASGLYSYNDLPAGQTDPDQLLFSIDHDRQSIIPRLKEAKVFNPALKLMGSPWSAPGWMKTSGSMIGGSLDPQWSASYALYFERFIQGYTAEGLPIDAISLQNEPLFVPGNYPGMGMSASQQTDLIKNHFGPRFAQNGIQTKILAYDHNWDVASYPLEVLDDPVANQYVAGSAFHGYGGNVTAQSAVHDAHPDKGIYFTEFSGGTWSPSFESNLVSFARDLFIGGTRNWTKNVLLWNLALDENGDPHQGGCFGCRGVVAVDSSSGAVTLNEEFYLLGHASKFILPGAVRISSSTQPGTLEAVAFRNPDDSEVLLSVNPSFQTQTLRLVREGEHFTYDVPPRSLATFVWNDSGADFDNGGFEEGGYETTGGSLDAWQVWGNSNANVAVSDELAAEGDHALQLAGLGATGTQAGAFQGISVDGSGRVRAQLSRYMPATSSLGGSNSTVAMKFEFYSRFGADYDSTARLSETAVVIADTDTQPNVWEFQQLIAQVPAGTAEARLVLVFDETDATFGAVYLDAISFDVIPGLAGDYNGDGVVDAVDYTVWRDTFGQNVATGTGADGDLSGIIGAGDYSVWMTGFGMSSGTNFAAATVPEPATLLHALLAIFLGVFSDKEIASNCRHCWRLNP